MKKSIVLVASLILLSFWIFPYHSSVKSGTETQIATSTSLGDQQRTMLPPQVPNSPKIHSDTEKPIKAEYQQTSDPLETSSCTTDQQLMSDPRLQAAQQWMEDSFGVDLATIANIYAYSTEAELQKAANNGDSTAMLALGMNYRWFALHTTFQSPRLRPKDLPEVVYTQKPLDKKIMDKARYWLMQAALNNQLAGLTELAYSYVDEAGDVDDMEAKKALEISAFAYLTLVDSMQPIGQRTIPAKFCGVKDKEQLTLFKNKQAELITQWREDRSNLGLNESLELNPSKDVIEFLALQRNVCRDI